MISNTCSGFGSMTVRNTNIVTKQEHDHLCNYEKKNFKHWIVNISFMLNIFRDFSSGSV